MRQHLVDFIERQIVAGVYPGVSLALFSCGKWQDYYLGTQDGVKSVEPGLVYDLASVSKVVGVGTLAIQLLQSGRLELDSPLHSYYPVFQDSRVTIRQLLTHTSCIDPFIPNRNQLAAPDLKTAIEQLQVRDERPFHYTDVNFLLLGFLLEKLEGQPLSDLFEERIFVPFGMTETSFGPRQQAVSTVRGVEAGIVHDPKARVLGQQAGSAGLFSTLSDLKRFVTHYLQDEFASDLGQDYGFSPERPRSLAWDKKGEWLSHTGYTGTFVLYHRRLQAAAIFLSNRTFEKDERSQWKQDRNELMATIIQLLEQEATE